MADEKLTPITPARVVTELKKLSEGRKSGRYDADEYEHRFARMVGELRDRSIDGNRAEIMAALTPLRQDGTLDPVAWERLTRSLGLS
ncbi:MAG TPA: hypothetical protein VIP80_09840 [Gemmatimonadales bacterium]|jgi:hypothetical protein